MLFTSGGSERGDGIIVRKQLHESTEKTNSISPSLKEDNRQDPKRMM